MVEERRAASSTGIQKRRAPVSALVTEDAMKEGALEESKRREKNECE